MDQSSRNQVFLSHANPQDNALTAWLGARLRAAGYAVWSDLERLRGGERIWPSIQTAIRDETKRFIYLGSRASAKSTGVLDEVGEALGAGKRAGDPNFVIPIRTDDLPWEDFPIQVKQIAGIDFHGDWPRGLAALLGVLERDGVPRTPPSPEQLRILNLYVDGQTSITRAPETLLSNWLPIQELPPTVHCYRSALSAPDLRSRRDQIAFPAEVHGRLVITFADPAFVQAHASPDFALAPVYEIDLAEFLSGKPTNAPEFGAEAGKMAISLLRQAWGLFAAQRGLPMAAGAPRWYVPQGWVAGDKAYYVDAIGKRGWRQLDGKAKDLRWHYAVSVRARLFDPRALHLVPHVMFSSDGVNLLNDQKGLRRRHCKLWWNDKWRDLMLAFLARLFESEEPTAAISLGGDALMKVGTRPASFVLPVSYRADDSHLPTEEEAELFERDDHEDEVLP